uniref:CRISPR-associated endoribonuclease Cas2 n=1 Tax=candidate division WOR-3 bacterium TaxID=2052148 RepID=A0A7C4CE44_UNCW3
MLVLVTYDVNTLSKQGQRRLRQVAAACEDFGQRVQKSVFECLLDPAQWADLRGRLTSIIKDDEDSLRFYFLGSNWKARVEHVGARPAYDPEGPLIV